MKHALFIYGTLMPGLRLEAEMHGARFMGPAQVPGRLVDVGRYPGFLQGNGSVSGEVYEVDAVHLARLDAVEDMVPGDRVASQYWREEVTVLSGPLQGQQVQTYVYNRPVDGCRPIPHGDYRRYIREVGRES
ncbi:gamma-glutamylcyclotransferase [Limnohabitans sp. Jir72]|uniref:gamma-glutamylcyclotransferase family protein n=1 Tax=Limnohabitans sp. Jir72 TaxID=1977909 RepID=UPI000D341AB7|nr:gamma-glutamylcyclotransferase family protein [Limnohabitans sp. Jir72]PUE29927.1 gamma-glutamylcyclotransferase [Limnohabitans sp. Jir72]